MAASDVKECRLALEDGSIWRGRAFGATDTPGVVSAEAVFNTAMIGYQESLTDPSYSGQILISTSPIVGIYGVNPEDGESEQIQVAGFVIHELSRRTSNWRSDRSLSEWLASEGILGMHGLDTRALTKRIRSSGAMRAALSSDGSVTDEALVATAKSSEQMAGRNLVPGVGVHQASAWAEVDSAPTVLVLDCGAKHNILRSLADRGCTVRRIPHDIPASEVVALAEAGKAHGLLVSNGPGDPAAVETTISMLRNLLDEPRIVDLPIFGICLGHQLLALAAGARTYKLKFGHRGVNQPVCEAATGRVEITSQNHGFAVDADSIREVGGKPSHINLNDGTLAGFELPGRPVFAVQHHPEASPGPHDAAGLFDRFVGMVRDRALATA